MKNGVKIGVPEYKLHPSQCSEIMTNPRSKSDDISQTLKTHCQLWLKQQKAFYNRKVIVSSKYFEKGTLTEEGSIKYYNNVKGTNFVKNKITKEDDFMIGTCDVDTGDAIFDFKNAYDFNTMPIFDSEPEKANWMQVQCYMYLYGRKKGGIIKVLSDMPESMLQEMTRFEARKKGITEDEAYESLKNHYTYFDVPDELRIVQFEFEYDPIFIENVKNKILLCREYIAKLKIIWNIKKS